MWGRASAARGRASLPRKQKRHRAKVTAMAGTMTDASRLVSRLACSAVLALAPGLAHAIDCTVSTTAAVSFGAYNPFATSPTTTSGTLTVNCTSVVGADNIIVDLSAGGGTYAARQLAGPASYTLDYNLYLDAPRTVVWGDGTGGTSSFGPVNPPNGDLVLPVYGLLPELQNVGAGSYADTIIVTVTF